MLWLIEEIFWSARKKNDKRKYEKIQEIAIGQGDDYTTDCLLDYPYSKENCKLIVTDLSKQQALDADQKAIKQINFTGNLEQAGNTTMIFILEEKEIVKVKEIVLDFSQGTVRAL